MPTYLCILEYDVEADSPEAAALEALSIIRDPESYPPVFQVVPYNEDGTPPQVCDAELGVMVDTMKVMEEEEREEETERWVAYREYGGGLVKARIKSYGTKDGDTILHLDNGHWCWKSDVVAWDIPPVTSE